MDGTAGLVFSWDPFAKAWVKERGPADASPPPAEPIDHLTVQTYFLNVENGHWESTILGLRARNIAGTMGNSYRSPMMTGLAILPPKSAAPKAAADTSGRGPVRIAGAILLVVVLVGGGAVAANAVLSPKTDAVASTAPGVVPSGPAATVAPTVAPTDAPAATNAPAQTAAPTSVRTQTPVRTVVPTVAPITTVTFSTRLTTGVTITATGPSAVLQGAAWDGQFRATQANGQLAFDNLTVYLGSPASGVGAVVKADTTGLYFVSIKASLAKGDQPVNVQFGRNGEIRTIGYISVR